MNFPRLPIWQQWLLHAFLLWAGIELFDALTYWYEVHVGGVYLINSDRTPVTQWQRFLNHNYYQAVGVVILISTLPIEINYHFLFRKKHLLYFLLSSSLTALSVVILLTGFNRWKFGGQTNALWGPTVVMVGYGFGYALLRDFMQQWFEKAQQKIQRSQAELAALKAQVNPHFFFNTLNTLYGTALLEQAEQTANCIEQLARIMRYTMTEAQHELTPVANELAFITDYLHLQRLRLPQRETIQVQTELCYDNQPAQIAPLLLIPFIENAFKYGIRMDYPCSVMLRIRVEQRQLTMVVENTRFPLRDNQTGLGTGIEHTRQRLQLLYPDKYQLNCRAEDDRYVVHLQVMLH